MSFGFSLGGVDIGGSALSGLSGFAVNSGGGGGALDFVGDMFGGAAKFAGGAFDWMGDNPEAANLLGGVALGVGQYYNAEKDREQAVRENRKDRELQRELAAQRIEAQQIAPGEGPSNYGSYSSSVTQGLLSDGLLARADEES
jgi:hypothetical protein